MLAKNKIHARIQGCPSSPLMAWRKNRMLTVHKVSSLKLFISLYDTSKWQTANYN